MFCLQVMYACAIFFSNPINLFPIFESLYKMKIIQNYTKDFSDKKMYWIKYLLRVIVIFICFLICLFIPNFINFISFVGSCIFPIIGIYIPLLLNYSYFTRKGTITKKKKIYIFTFVLICFIVFTSATIDSLLRKH